MPLIGPGRRMRRRAVVGAAAVGGAAYYAGKKGAQAGQEADQDQMPEEREAQEAPAPVKEDYIEELEQLAKLHRNSIHSGAKIGQRLKSVLA